MSFTDFKGFNSIGNSSVDDIIKTGVESFFNWAFLRMGAYFNVQIPTSGTFGGNEHILKRQKDPNYTDGQVWQSVYSNWVWESGLGTSHSPIDISGVFVNNVFMPTSGNEFSIDYPNGRIIFDTAKAASSEVKLEYSHRYVNIYDGDSTDWLREVNEYSYRPDSASFSNFGSGDFNQLGSIKLPAIILDLTNTANLSPYMLGLGQNLDVELVCHVLGPEREASKIADILHRQDDKTIFLLHLDLMKASGVFPLDMNGGRVENAKMYPELVAPREENGYRLRKMYFLDAVREGKTELHPNLYQLPVNYQLRTYLPNI